MKLASYTTSDIVNGKGETILQLWYKEVNSDKVSMKVLEWLLPSKYDTIIKNVISQNKRSEPIIHKEKWHCWCLHLNGIQHYRLLSLFQ